MLIQTVIQIRTGIKISRFIARVGSKAMAKGKPFTIAGVTI